MSSAALENGTDQALPEAQVEQGANTQQESPPAASEGVNESMLDVVQAALKPKEEAPASDEPDPAKAEAPGAAAEEPIGELTDDELNKYGPRAQKRIRDLVQKNKELAGFRQEVEPKVQSFDKMMGFVREKGLTTEEVDFTFAIMAAVKESPQLAYDALRPILGELERRIGVKLPEDLQNDVRIGLITPERATELSRARAQAQLATSRVTEVTQQTQQRQAVENHQRFVGSVHSTIGAWEQQQAQKDPDWSLKSPRMAERLELELRRDPSRVRTPQQAIALAESIKSAVDAELRAIRPKPREIRPGASGGSSSPRSPAAPQSMLDVVMGAVGAR